MLDEQQMQRITRMMPVLQKGSASILDEFRRVAFYARLPAGRDVFVQDDDVEAIALLLSGSVRVYKVGETGREITLYRFGEGQSCILSTNAILNKRTFDAIATVEQEAEAIMIPADTFREWVNKYDLWRDFVFNLLSQRLSTVMEIVDEVAFRRMDLRVSALLLERARVQNPVSVTHQEIAAELGSSREVISRILENLAALGLIRMMRGAIEVIDPDALADFAAR